MNYVHVVAVLAVLQFFLFGILVGRARARYGVKAPATSGSEPFERAFRVHMNTLEQLVGFLPALLIASLYWPNAIVAGIGAVYLVGRFVYRRLYIADPAKRGFGFLLTVIPTFTLLAAALVGACLATPVAAQTVTVVGTRHLTGMEQRPSAEQFAHTIDALSAFAPTQVCVERMSGERIEALVADPARHGATFQPDWHGRPLASVVVPTGVAQQLMLERRPADARSEAGELVARWHELDTADQARAIGLQLAGFDFHSAVLNWSWLDDAERNKAGEMLGPDTVEALDEALASVHEVYSLGVPLARKAGLHELCTADSQEDETAGMHTALQHGGEAVLEGPQVSARFDELSGKSAAAWQPESGPGALTAMLRFFNGDEYAELDRRLQWETLREFDNEAAAFHRRLMYWHARTAEISAELFRALAQGPEERVLLVIGSAHRPFTEADLRAQPWIDVRPASLLLEAK